MKKLLALPAVTVRRKKAFQKAARAGQSRSEVRPAVTETTCAQWRAGCFNLVLGMGEASGRRAPQRSRHTRPSSFPLSCTVQRPGFSIGSRSDYWSGFTNAACAPSLTSNGKTACQMKKSSREPLYLSCFRCSYAGFATSQGWKTYACLKQSSSSSSSLSIS